MYHFVKRVLDFISAFLFLFFFSWFYALIFLLYLITFNFPVFFKQKRTGWKQQPFNLIKFRTLKNSNGSYPERRFLLGDLLRTFSLDELPQAWQVLVGQMSWIGPRPLPVEYLNLMNEQQKKRYAVRPGITGWTQVNGRHELSWKQKFELDAFYIEQVSFGLDLKILAKTVLLLLSFKKDQSLDEKQFTGN